MAKALQKNIEPVLFASVGSGVLALALAGLFSGGGGNFSLDDTWIHLSYALSLKLGEGFSYNPGDWETGSSSPLWVVLLWLWPLGADPVLRTKVLCALLHAATAALSAALAIRLALDVARETCSRRRILGVGLLAGAIAASQPQLLQGAASGMEVSLAACLLVGVTLSCVKGAPVTTFFLAAAAALARPETVAYVAVLVLTLAAVKKQTRFLWGLAGAGSAIGCWMVYCQLLSGYPWPNTKYAKSVQFGLQGIDYLLVRVLPEQPWLVSLGGAVLMALAIVAALRRKRPEPAAIVVAWTLTLLAVAMSRPLQLHNLFYLSRYFAIAAAIPAVIVGYGMVGLRATLTGALVLPIAVVTVLQVREAASLERVQERNIATLHTQPARYLASHLPADAVVVVEGAGATRFFTPRSMRIVDMQGLNHAAIAHARDDYERICTLVAEQPRYALIPEVYLRLSYVFVWRILRRFDEPYYAIIDPPRPKRVLLLEITGIKPGWLNRCSRMKSH